MIVDPVSPLMGSPFLNHSNEVPPVAVKICESFSHNDAVAGLIVPAGADSCVITDVFDAGPVQLPFVMVTLYVPASLTVSVALF